MEHKIGLKFFRKRLGLSQEEIAEKLDCVKTTYQSWENGRREPSVDIIRKLFVLGATVEELFGVKVETKECLPSKGEFEKQVELALIKMIKNGEVVLSVKKG
jgi:transcriptional regulator with XRE-family HTH domain